MTIFDCISVLLIVAGALTGWHFVALYSNVLAVPAALAGGVIVRLVGLFILGLAWPRARKLPRADGCHTLMFTMAALGLGGWLFASLHSSRVAISERDHCTVHFYWWGSGNCILDFYRDGKRAGGTTLGRGMFEHPLAVFPGPDGRSVICFSWLDTSYAVFSVDLRQWPDPEARGGVWIMSELQEAVNHSDFPVRACTKAEVAFVAELITHADLSRVAIQGADWVPLPLLRERFLDFLRIATTPRHLREPRLREGYPPRILPTG